RTTRDATPRGCVPTPRSTCRSHSRWRSARARRSSASRGGRCVRGSRAPRRASAPRGIAQLARPARVERVERAGRRPRSPQRPPVKGARPTDGVPGGGDRLWYKDAIIYELRVGAFQDSDDDGIGDFRGLTSRLEYLSNLGVTALWLLPFYPSPMRDDGYDIAD